MVNTRGMKSKTKSATESGIKTEIKAQLKAEPKAEIKAEIKSETKPKTKPKTMSDKPSTSGLVLTAGPSWNVARQTPFGKKKRKKVSFDTYLHTENDCYFTEGSECTKKTNDCILSLRRR